MTFDRDLLRDAEAARDRLVEAQHAVERARADYHRAIRRLHAAGRSLREIAEALGLSHQRIHQIVDEAAEPRWWWQRRGRGWQGPAGPCSFCGRSREEVARLVAGPGVFICDGCVTRVSGLPAGAALEEGADAPLLVEPPGSRAKCSFCGKQVNQVQRLVASGLTATPTGKFGQTARICNECLALCEQILAETASS